MNPRFWLSFLISVFICFVMVFFISLLFAKKQEIKAHNSLFKKNIKLESLLYMERLHKQFDFWQRERARILRERDISADSPFFALIDESFLQEKRVYFDKDSFPSQLLDPKHSEPHFKTRHSLKNGSLNPDPKHNEPAFETEAQKISAFAKNTELSIGLENTLLALSQEILETQLSEGFLLKTLKIKGMEEPLALIRVVEAGAQWIGFFRFDSRFFQLPSALSKSKGKMKKEFFVINPEGRVFFHNHHSRIFNRISNKSKLWKSLSPFLNQERVRGKYDTHTHPNRSQIPNQERARGKYIKLHKRKGQTDIYYLQKWGSGAMLFLSKAGFPSPFFIDSFAVWLPVCFIIFLLFFALFLMRLFSLVSAYRFLKFAFLSFEKAEELPAHPPNNPLLYFYNNRLLFLNQRRQKKVSEKRDAQNFTFQDLIDQEIQKLKAEFPNLQVDKKYDYDTKVFGFERFLKTIIHELLLNAVEAMGGLKRLKLDIALKKEEENILFYVRDYGQGAGAQNYDRFLEMYHSTKSQLGVGLNVVQSLVQANKGNLQFSSPEKGGVEVLVRLPLKVFLRAHP